MLPDPPHKVLFLLLLAMNVRIRLIDGKLRVKQILPVLPMVLYHKSLSSNQVQAHVTKHLQKYVASGVPPTLSECDEILTCVVPGLGRLFFSQEQLLRFWESLLEQKLSAYRCHFLGSLRNIGRVSHENVLVTMCHVWNLHEDYTGVNMDLFRDELECSIKVFFHSYAFLSYCSCFMSPTEISYWKVNVNGMIYLFVQ